LPMASPELWFHVLTQEETPEGLKDKTVYKAPTEAGVRSFIDLMKPYYKHPLRIERGPPPPKRIIPPMPPTGAEIPLKPEIVSMRQYYPPLRLTIINPAPKEREEYYTEETKEGAKRRLGHYLNYVTIGKKPWDQGIVLTLSREYRREPRAGWEKFVEPWTETHEYQRYLARPQVEVYNKLIGELKALKRTEPIGNQERILAALEATKQSMTHTIAAVFTEMSPDEADIAMRELVRKGVILTVETPYLPEILGEKQRLPYVILKEPHRARYILDPRRPITEDMIEWRYDPEKVKTLGSLEGYFTK